MREVPEGFVSSASHPRATVHTLPLNSCPRQLDWVWSLTHTVLLNLLSATGVKSLVYTEQPAQSSQFHPGNADSLCAAHRMEGEGHIGWNQGARANGTGLCDL